MKKLFAALLAFVALSAFGQTFTVNNLTVNGTLAGTGVTNYFSSPSAIGNTAANSGSFTTLSASSTVSGTGFSTYLASPPAIGGTAAAAGSFTNLSSSGTVSGTGFSNYLASPPAIGGTVAAAGTFTALTATTSTSVPNATTSAQALAYGQSITSAAWSNVTGSRTLGSTFTNSTSHPIMVSVWATNNGATSSTLTGLVGGSGVANSTSSPATAGLFNALTFIVPAGATYGVNVAAGAVTLSGWWELR